MGRSFIAPFSIHDNSQCAMFLSYQRIPLINDTLANTTFLTATVPVGTHHNNKQKT